MKSRIIKLILLIALFAFTRQTKAQTCTGSLGDPVIYQTFGSGATNPGPALPAGVTTMQYTTDACPNDGFYTIENAVNINQACHSDWHIVTADHTGDPNGYMMVINANVQPSVFFTETANGLCPNTTYEFSSYIMNLGTLASLASNYSKPDITFTIQTNDGTVLKTIKTGEILPTANPTWTKYGTYFKTPPNVTDVVVTMMNNAPGGNGNDLILDDIAFRACGPIVQTGFGNLTANGDLSVCEGSNINYTLTSSVGPGYILPSLQWQSNFNNTGWTDISGQTALNYSLSLSNAAPGTYQYRLSVGEGNNINIPSCFVSSNSLTIQVNPKPVVTLPVSQTLCNGDILTLTATGGASYNWSGPGLASSSQNPLVITASNQTAGTYTVIATSDKGCVAAPVQTKLIVEPKVLATISSNAAICAGGTTQLHASGGLYYQWSPSTGLDHDNIADPIASPAQTTTYAVKVSNDACFDNSKSVTVTVYNNPIAKAGPDKVLFAGQSVKLEGTITGDNITSISWSPAEYLNDPNSLTPIATPPHDITYTLTAQSQSCGLSSNSVNIRVYQKITIPNTFTPNGDGINDYWTIDALITYPQSQTTVYTRDGQQVFKSIGYPKPWDGTCNGKQVTAGTYYYIIDLKNGQPPFSGWVLVQR